MNIRVRHLLIAATLLILSILTLSISSAKRKENRLQRVDEAINKPVTSEQQSNAFARNFMIAPPAANAELGISKMASSNPVNTGSQLNYTITVTNNGPDEAANASWSDTLPNGTTFLGLSAPPTWSCTMPDKGNTGTISCTNPAFAVGSDVFTLSVTVIQSVPAGSTISNTATVTSTTPDSNGDNNSSTATTTVLSPSSVSGIKQVSGGNTVGSTISYLVILSNASGSDQQDNPGDEFTDVLPPGLTLVSADASSGTAAANTATNTVTWNGIVPAGDTVTITITATINSGTEGQTISNQGTINFDADGNGTNESSVLTDDPNDFTSSSDPTVFTVCASTAVVTTSDDNVPGSLRQVIADACPGITITFDMTQVTSPIKLTSGELTIDKDLTIQGPTTTSLTISGENSSRIFNVASLTNLSISNLTLTSGSSSFGGAIYSIGNLTITNSTFTGNSAAGEGGAIDSEGGNLFIINSTISGNTADTDGGGLLNCGSSIAVLTNVTITNNRADATGGGFGEGGGIGQVSSSSLTLNNTIVAGNTKGAAPGTPDDIFVKPESNPGVSADQSFIDPGSSNNLIGVDTGLSTDISNGVNGNQIGTSGAPIDPRLGPLANNGGPTQTHYLLSDSPALNAGNNSLAIQNGTPLTTDQRGTGFPRIINSVVDIGALEANYGISATAGTPQSAVINTAFATQLKATATVNGNPLSGASVTFTAPSSGASGTFQGGGTTATVTTDANGVATAPVFTANGTAGVYFVTASLPSGLPSASFTLTNTRISQTITFNALPDKTFGDADFNVSATASSGLPVSFAASGQCTVSGNTVHITGAGSCTITASQNGDINYFPAADVQRIFSIAKANQTITFNALPDKTFGDGDFSVSATASSGLPVSFVASGQCTVTGTTVHITGAGSCQITASQAGNANFNAAADVVRTFQIAKANQTITFNALPDKTFGNADFGVSATASSGLAVTFAASGQCTISGSTVHLTGAGSCTITASQAGNSNFNAAPDVQRSFNIAKAATTTGVTSSQNPSSSGQSVTFTATVTSGAGTPTGTVQFKDNGTNIGSPVALNGSGVATISTSTLTTGSHTITADYSGDANFNTSTGTLSAGQQVNPSLSINDLSLTEGDSGTKSFSFTVTLSAASNLTVKVDFATANDTATAGSDYVATSGTLTFNPGDLTKTVSVTVNGDTQFESNETFFVNLTNAINASTSKAQGTGTILNDDVKGGIISFSQSAYTATEGTGSTLITVNRTNDTSQAVTVDYASSDQFGLAPCSTVNGQASERCDYLTAIGTVSFAAGETQKSFLIFITDDTYQEGTENFSLTLSNPTGGALLGNQSAASVTISDNNNDVSGAPNPIDGVDYFIRSLYIDFLYREPDTIGFKNWQDTLNNCPNTGFGLNNPQCDRVHVAYSFYGSFEFRDAGYLIFRFYNAVLGKPPTYKQFMHGLQMIGGAQSPAQSEANKQLFAAQFITRPDFQGLYDQYQTGDALVNALIQTSQVTPANKQQLIDNYATVGRAATVRAFIETKEVNDAFFNRGFVTMLYFGFLRREPDTIGFNNYLQKLQQNGDPRPMVFDFIYSNEYRGRFGQP